MGDRKRRGKKIRKYIWNKKKSVEKFRTNLRPIFWRQYIWLHFGPDKHTHARTHNRGHFVFSSFVTLCRRLFRPNGMRNFKDATNLSVLVIVFVRSRHEYGADDERETSSGGGVHGQNAKRECVGRRNRIK